MYRMLEVWTEAHLHSMYIHSICIHFSRFLTALYNENTWYLYTSSILLLKKQQQHTFKGKAESLRFIANPCTQMPAEDSGVCSLRVIFYHGKMLLELPCDTVQTLLQKHAETVE